MPVAMFNPCRPCCRRSGKVAVVVFVDEAASVYTFYPDWAAVPPAHRQNYLDDVASWNALLATHSQVTVRPGVLQVDAGLYFPLAVPRVDQIVPHGEALPPGWAYGIYPRNVASPAMITFFEAVRAGDTPGYVIILVDDSGSMTLADVQPGFDQFRDYLTSTYPGVVIRAVITPLPEKWVGYARDALANLFSEFGM